MLTALKFAQRAIARSGLAPTLSCFRMSNGRVTASNGVLAMSAPLTLSFEAAPAAVHFTKAIDACEGPMTIAQDSPTRMTVKAGGFKASIPCLPVATIPTVRPEGEFIPNISLVDAFKMLRPFVSTDDQPDKAWANGIMLDSQYAWATNNVTLTQCWLGGSHVPFKINIPLPMVDEIIHVRDEPTTLQVGRASITAHYADGRWIRSQLSALEWPNLGTVLESAWEGRTLESVRLEFKDACAKLAKFAGKDDHKTYLRGLDVATARSNDTDGIASVAVLCDNEGCYHTRYLADVLAVAEAADFGNYPRPVPFVGGMMRGVICGVRG